MEYGEYEMQELGREYPEYDNMDYTQLTEVHDSLIEDRDDPYKIFDHNRLEYVEKLMDLKDETMESSFIDDDNGQTVTTTNRNKTAVSVPRVDFVEQTEEQIPDYINVGDDSFNLAFKEGEEIERRLNDLKGLNREIAKEQVERVKIINEKIQKLNGKN